MFAVKNSTIKMTSQINVLEFDRFKTALDEDRGRSRINFRVLQNFPKKLKIEMIQLCRKIIDSARSKKVWF